jgi:outer membrane protein TolC
MWSVGVSITLPLWSRSKQQRAVAEQEWRFRAGNSEVESIQHRLSERIHERSTRLASVLASLRLYRQGLLVQSEATFQATLAQYEAGRVPLLSALEALQGWIADRSGLLQTQAQAHGLQIALEEMSLGPTPSVGSAVLSAASMGSGAAIPSSNATRSNSKSDAGSSSGAPSMGSM